MILDFPEEILDIILSKVTDPVKPEFTREPDGGWYPNGETEWNIDLLEHICSTFRSRAKDAHFHLNTHRAVLRHEAYPIYTPTGDVYRQRAVLDCPTSTFTEDNFLLDNIRHLEVAPKFLRPAGVQLMADKIEEIVGECAEIRDVTINVGRIRHHHMAATQAAIHTAINNVEQQKVCKIKLCFTGMPLPH